MGLPKRKPTLVGGGQSQGRRRFDNYTLIDQLVWKPGSVLLAEDVQAAMATVNELADGVEYPMLIDIANTQKVTRQARSVFSVGCAPSKIALIASSP